LHLCLHLIISLAILHLSLQSPIPALASFADMPCIVRNLTDEQAITQMVEDNTNQRENILPSERANALKMQLDAIKRQGMRGDIVADKGKDGAGDKTNNATQSTNNTKTKTPSKTPSKPTTNGTRSNEIVADRNGMTVKQVQRYIKLACGCHAIGFMLSII